MLLQLFKSLLGADGATTLSRLLKTDLSSYITPRVIVSWLRQSPLGTIEIPPGCPLQALNKSTEGFSGGCSINTLEYKFDRNSVEQVAAVIITALGVETTRLTIRDKNLAKLAKTIDALVKAHGAAEKPLEPNQHDKHIKPLPSEQPLPPQQPLPVVKQPARRIPSTKRPRRSLRVTKAESAVSCSSCQEKMFLSGKFVGCVCFKPLAKSVTTNLTKEGCLLSFGPEWDSDAYLSLVSILKYGGSNG